MRIRSADRRIVQGDSVSISWVALVELASLVSLVELLALDEEQVEAAAVELVLDVAAVAVGEGEVALRALVPEPEPEQDFRHKLKDTIHFYIGQDTRRIVAHRCKAVCLSNYRLVHNYKR